MNNFCFNILSLLKTILVVLLVTSIFVSCNTTDNDFTIGKEFIENTTDIIIVDTFSVELSTIKFDSIQTSGTGNMLVGYYVDGDFGRVFSQSYFQPSLPDDDIQTDDTFDSLTLILPYSSYFYGDTNTISNLKVYRLSEKLVDYSISNFYNTSDIKYFSTPIGEKTFYPRPNRDSVVEIKLDDLLGKEIFYKIRDSDEDVASFEYFIDYIKGFTIIPDTSISSSIIGYDGENVGLKMYTSRETTDDIEELTYLFTSYSTTYQFNKIRSDRTGTFLENLMKQENELNASITNNKSFVQAGVGILTKVRFPYLKTLFFDDILILSIELIIKPDIDSYEGNLPETLVLYETNEKNQVVSQLADDEGSTLSSTFNLDEMYHLETYYSFDITNFLETQIEDNYIDNERALLIAIPDADFYTSLERLIISSTKSTDLKPKLKITYLKN